MHILDVLEAMCDADFVFTRLYQQLNIKSASGLVVGEKELKIIRIAKPLILNGMQGGRGYSALELLDHCEARLEREAIQFESCNINQ